jgi:hypothetical protein
VKTIDSYFAKFSNIPNSSLLREAKRGTTAHSMTPGVTITTTQPLPEDAPQYTYVGKIAIEWANLEAAIDWEIWTLCGHPNLIACLTAQMIGPSPRLQALIAICAEKKLELKTLENLEEFKRHAQGVADQRNRFVHDSWHVIASELTGRKTFKKEVTARGRLKIASEEITPEQFERIIFKIRRLTDIFENSIRSDIISQTRA